MKTITIPFRPTPVQSEVYAHPARFKVLVMGRRGGKSTLALNFAQRRCLEKPGARVWIICTTYGNAKDIYWRDANMIKRYIITETGAKINESELVIAYPNGSVLQFKGADRPETLRGSGLDLIVLDEISEWRYAEDTWNAVLSPALADKQGEALFIGTPKGENFFKSLFDLGQSPDHYYTSWQIPTWESGAPWTLTPEGKAELERERLGKAEEWFMQEYGAEFRKFTGLVFKEFDRKLHVMEFEVPSRYDIMCGMDFGWTNPTTNMFTYLDDDDNFYVFDEYGDTEKPVREHAGKILAKRYEYDNAVKAILGDSANSQTIQEFNQYQWYVTPVKKDKDSVINGINRMSDRMVVNPATGKPKLFIHPRCTQLIYELERYKWKEQKNPELNDKDQPEDANDHYIDAVRYVINHHNTSRAKPGKMKPIPFTYRPKGGYN